MKYLRNTSEVKRIENEKRLRREFEAAEERNRLEYLRLMQLMADKSSSVTKIINRLFRKPKAKAIVMQKKMQLKVL